MASNTVTTGMISGDLAEFLADRIPKAANRAHRRFPMVPAEDFESAMWERVYRRRSHFTNLWTRESLGAIWEELRREGVKVGKEDDRYRRACKAAEAGFSLLDIEFYSTAVIELILEPLVAADFDVAAAIENATNSTDAAGVRIGSNDPFGGAENYMVILLDVAAAYERLPEGMKRLLKTYYGVRQDDTEQGRWERQGLAGSMGLTDEALRQRVHRAVRRLQDGLGGADPWL